MMFTNSVTTAAFGSAAMAAIFLCPNALAQNVDTSLGGINFGATISGMNGYVTVGPQRADGSNALSSSGVQLAVASVQIVQ